MSRRLAWRVTIIGGRRQPDDYVGEDPQRPVAMARIYRAQQGPKAWYWTVSAEMHIASGYEATHSEAADAAERAYTEWEQRQG